MPKRGPPLQVLCLHDAGSNADHLKMSLQKLGDRLWTNHGIDLVFCNAPLVVQDEHDQRAWWQSSSDSSSSSQENPYLGLDASLLMVKQMWSSQSYWGILGIGQGAALAALLTLWLLEECQGAGSASRAPPQCAIFVDGFTVLPEDYPLVSIQVLEALHIILAAPGGGGSNCSHNHEAQFIDPSATARLVTQMGGQSHVRLVGEDWYSTDCLNRMGRYLVQQKLAQSSSLTVTQQALVQSEQQAAHLVQQYALQNPPSSLMAVIGPSQHVAGWSGPKRSLPANGAPCPADFVLPIHKRQTQEINENNQP